MTLSVLKLCWLRYKETLHGEPCSGYQSRHLDADTGLQRRMDYSPDVNGNPLVAHYTTEHHDFGGLIVPTRRRVLIRNEKGVADQSFCAILPMSARYGSTRDAMTGANI